MADKDLKQPFYRQKHKKPKIKPYLGIGQVHGFKLDMIIQKIKNPFAFAGIYNNAAGSQIFYFFNIMIIEIDLIDQSPDPSLDKISGIPGIIAEKIIIGIIQHMVDCVPKPTS
jgi:hypothetical protein